MDAVFEVISLLQKTCRVWLIRIPKMQFLKTGAGFVLSLYGDTKSHICICAFENVSKNLHVTDGC